MKKIIASTLALLMVFAGIPVGHAEVATESSVMSKYHSLSSRISSIRSGGDGSDYWTTEEFMPSDDFGGMDDMSMIQMDLHSFESEYVYRHPDDGSTLDWDRALSKLERIESSLWRVQNGYTGQSSVNSSNNRIENYKTQLTDFVTSVDGSEVESTQKWLTADQKTAVLAKLDALKVVNDSLDFTGNWPGMSVSSWRNKESEAFDFVTSTFNAAPYGSIVVPTEASLKTLYDAANLKWSRIFVSTDSDEVLTGHYYVDQTAYDAMKSALETAQSFLTAHAGDTDADWTSAETALENAKLAFEGAMHEGSFSVMADDIDTINQMEQAAADQKAAIEALVVSVDGTDVSVEDKWITAAKKQELLGLHTQMTSLLSDLKAWVLNPGDTFNAIQMTASAFSALNASYTNLYSASVQNAPAGTNGLATEDSFDTLLGTVEAKFSRILVETHTDNVLKGHHFVSQSAYDAIKAAVETAQQFKTAHVGDADANWQSAQTALKTAQTAFEGAMQVGTDELIPSEIEAIDNALATLETQKAAIDALAVSTDGKNVPKEQKWVTAAQKEAVLSQYNRAYDGFKALKAWSADQDTDVFNTVTVLLSTIEEAYVTYLSTYDAVVKVAAFGQGQTPTTPTPEPEDDADDTDSGVTIVVNGTTQNAGTIQVKTVAGERRIDIVVNEAMIRSKLKRDAEKDDVDKLVEVPVNNVGDVTQAALSGETVSEMVKGGYTFGLNTPNFRYDVKLDAVDILTGETALNVAVALDIRKLSDERLTALNTVAKASGHTLVGEPRAVGVTVTNGTAETRIENFSTYVPRTFSFSKVEKITTGVVMNADGTYEHVPTVITIDENGKQQVRVNSLTNSEYALIYNPVKLEVAEGHAYEDQINDMASRLIVTGTGSFDPDEAITRGAFIEYVTKTLGLYRKDVEASNTFTDEGTESQVRAVAIAEARDIVNGYVDGTFGYDKALTVQEMNIVYNRLLPIIGSDEEAREVVKSMETVTHGEVLALLNALMF